MPLTAISLFLQNLASGIYDPADPEARENLRLIYNETCYLERLVADLLDFSAELNHAVDQVHGMRAVAKRGIHRTEARATAH